VIGRAGNPGGRRAQAPRPAGPEPLAPVLGRILKDLRIEERSREGALATAWDAAAGPDLSAKARPVSFRSGLLTVEVEGAALLQEVRGFRARALLSALKGSPGGAKVREIRFVPAGRTGGEA
jgi:hypothetical protein